MFKKGILEKKRALISQEITQLFVNTDTNLLGKNLMMAFAQVAKSHSVRKMMRKGKNIAEKHALTFTQKLQEEDLPSPSSLDLGVTDSQEAPFSDKLMLFLTAFLNAAGIGNYGLAMASSVRQDLALMYVRLTTETALFADDCADLLIKNGWMEEPPEAPDRKGLMDTKE
nr:DUF3231 family protein [Aquibacillus albus]